MSRAAYMREYRAKKKHNTMTPPNGTTGDLIGFLENEVDRLAEEVARLKRELAARPATTPVQPAQGQRDPSFGRSYAAPKPSARKHG